MIGNILLGAALITSLAVMLKCSIQKEALSKQVKILSAVSLGLIILASLYLWFLILTNDFGTAYVASYSSISLPTVYKVSAFWAGQQGSFLLWLLFHAIAGIILIFQRTSNSTLSVYNFLQAMLAILVLVKSPFEPSEVEIVDDCGNIHMKWQCGRGLALIAGVDSFEVIKGAPE